VPVITSPSQRRLRWSKDAHKYGGKVIATVVNARHAKRAAGLTGLMASLPREMKPQPTVKH